MLTFAGMMYAAPRTAYQYFFTNPRLTRSDMATPFIFLKPTHPPVHTAHSTAIETLSVVQTHHLMLLYTKLAGLTPYPMQ